MINPDTGKEYTKKEFQFLLDDTTRIKADDAAYLGAQQLAQIIRVIKFIERTEVFELKRVIDLENLVIHSQWSFNGIPRAELARYCEIAARIKPDEATTLMAIAAHCRGLKDVTFISVDALAGSVLALDVQSSQAVSK